MNPYLVAEWDLGALRAHATRLVEVAESARAWVGRGDAVRAGLVAPGAWDGPGSEAALADLGGWLATVARVGPPLLALAEGIEDGLYWYVRAQDHAATALRAAAAGGISVSPAGEVSPSAQPDLTGLTPEQAAPRLERAAVAATVEAALADCRAAVARGDALLRSDIGQFHALGLPGFDADSSYPQLALGLGTTTTPIVPFGPIPIDETPAAVARWWSGLPLDLQLRLVGDRPEVLGNLDGVSPWARDMANRAVLERLLPPARDDEFTAAVAAALTVAAAGGQPVQLYSFDPRRGTAAISVGDMDTAESVAVLVPGMGVTVSDDMSNQTGHAVALWDATQVADPNGSVAVVAWIGYDTPGPVEAPFPFHATGAAPVLASMVGGVAARPGGAPRTTVVAHSYGTVVLAEAMDEPGRLGADAVVLVGSPGIDPWSDVELPLDEVYVGEGSLDVVAWTGWHGVDPGDTWLYGGTCIEAGNERVIGNMHNGYFDMTSEALWNMAYVVQEQRARVARC